MGSITASLGTITIITTTAMTTTTTTNAALYQLLAWLSPAYPVGSFTYSHGLETAVEDGRVRDRSSLVAYIETVLLAGAGRIDGAFLAAAWRAAAADDTPALDALVQRAAAWRGTAELALESMAQGTAFISVTLAAWPEARLAGLASRHRRAIVHPVAYGAAAGFHGLPLLPALVGWLAAFGANLVSAGVRLVPLGQTDGQMATAALQPIVAQAADAALGAELESMGTAAPLIDLLSMRHETQYTRLFRS